jgi:FAD dependent oxidoreductase TIGR03364
MAKQSAIVIGAGIVGLATAKALAGKGFSVKIFERTQKAVGASIRNFGMVLPVGQPAGKMYQLAVHSKNIWKKISDESNIWSDPVGSMWLAYHEDEWQVLQEAYEIFLKEGRPVQLLNKEQAIAKSPAAVEKNLLGALFSADELIVDPREAIAGLPAYLSEKFSIEFHWGKSVSHIFNQTVFIGSQEKHQADLIFVCSGADMETLYPDEFARQPLTKCKLQMMRMMAQPNEWRIGPMLCAGLSLTHYKSFRVAASLPQLKKRFEEEMPDYLKWGIHVMVSQNGKGELTIGDSHEYSLTHDPFDKGSINQMILDYLRKFAQFKDDTIVQTWNGIYPIFTNDQTHLFLSPEKGVYIFNGVSGAGMTLSFGLAEELIEGL